MFTFVGWSDPDQSLQIHHLSTLPQVPPAERLQDGHSGGCCGLTQMLCLLRCLLGHQYGWLLTSEELFAPNNTCRHRGYHGEGNLLTASGPCSVAVAIVIPVLTQRKPFFKISFQYEVSKQENHGVELNLKKKKSRCVTYSNYIPLWAIHCSARGRVKEDKGGHTRQKNVRKNATRNLIMTVCV